ncbi:MAG: hypothetical protein EPO50_11485 [Reyranella sp.]|nr:MAG: hypothetical protein EPO50_11485 [Reyranella sp.]
MSFFGDTALAVLFANTFMMFLVALWLWLWLLITTAADLLSRKDISGFRKALWAILVLALPYVGIFAYILTQGTGMAERRCAKAWEAREELRAMASFSAADELVKLDRLKSRNALSEQEYLTLRERLLA